MAKSSLTDTQKKKLELENELKKIQSDIDETLEEVKTTASETIGPKSLIKKYPLPAIGAAFVLGLLAGTPSKTKSSTERRSSSKNDGIGGMIAQELKRLVVKKGINVLSQKIDEQISSGTTSSEDSDD